MPFRGIIRGMEFCEALEYSILTGRQAFEFLLQETLGSFDPGPNVD
jgi:hypothetical protein